MKRLFASFILVMLAGVLLALVGCSQAEDSLGDSMSMKSTMQSTIDGVRVSVIDVGKGDCILVQVGDSAALIDTGYDDTSNEVVSYLRNQGVSRLECLVITHYDRDHIGGIRATGKSFDIGTIYLPGYQGGDKHYRAAMAAVDELGFPTKQVSDEQALQLGDASFSILPSSLTYVPNADGGEGNDNDLSLVATLTFQNDSYLFTGDLEKEGIDSFLKRERGRFDVLKVPHHGEKSGGTDDLLESVHPQVAIITDSADDPADKKTLKLLNSSGAETYRTSTCGTVVVESAGTGSYSVSVDAGQ